MASGGSLKAEPAEIPQDVDEALIKAPSGLAGREPLGVGMLSLGCPKNLVDGEVMLGRLQRAGYRLVADTKQADVVVGRDASPPSRRTWAHLTQGRAGPPG